MDRLGKFLRLPGADRRLLMKAALLVWAFRMALWLLPFRIVRQFMTRFAREAVASGEGSVPVDRVVWAVTVASRYAPAATCLTQALATKLLLARCGHQATVRIGVARHGGGELQAHAWVESNGRVVIGGLESSLKDYTPLAAADGDLW
jgi:hypothetical protein